MKRGLVRTFQITTLFRGLTVLENVTLAVGERHGVAGDLLRPAGARRAVIEEAFALLERLGIADEALRPVRELAYGRQRLVEIAVALGLEPKVLLLDEPAAGVPSAESGTIIDDDRAAAAPTSRCSSSSTTWTWCSAWRGASPCWCRARSWSRAPPQEIAADPRVREVYLGEREPHERRRAAPLALEGVRAGYGDTVVLEGVSLGAARPGGTLAMLGRNGVGKTTLLADHHGPHHACMAARIRFAGARDSARCRPIAARGSASASCRRSARSSAR